MKKTTIYIDVEDDIAGIIDKVTSATERIVALVLPKRPSVLQSSVNVRLLKKAAEDSSKSIVLITNDDQVMKLAGVSAMHVSKSLQSKPYVPEVAPDSSQAVEEINDDGSLPATDPAQPDVYKDDQKIDLATPVGELTGEGLDEIELDNVADADAKDDKTADNDGKKKRLHVPSFAKFRLRLVLLIVGIVLLGGFLYWALAMAPSANVVISTEKSDKTAKVTVTAAASQQTVDAATMTVPAVKKEDKQKLSTTFTATGKKDVGEKATGTVTFTNCESTSAITIPSGTGVSRSAYTYITQEAVTLEGGKFSGGGTVCTSDASEPVSVVASQPGDQYNLAPGTYTVAGDFGNIRASGSAMGGGTTKFVTVVTQEDVETAKQKALDQSADNVKGKLSTQLTEEGLVPIEDTYVSQNGEPVTSVAVGAEATSDVSLTIEVVSSMLGMKINDLDPIVTAELNKQIDTKTQKIYDTGLDEARVEVIERPAADTSKVTVTTTSQIGPNLDKDSIASEIAGKRAGEAKQLLEAKTGVTNANISLNPFWVFNIPKKTSKISITINE